MPVNLPNIITIFRILLVPLAIWLIVSKAFGAAFLVFVLAGVSDAVDGFVARQYKLQSELGAYLDPIADKALLVSIYLSLAILKFIPVWLAILVVTRDVLIVSAVMLAWLMDKPVAMKPLWVSKVNTTGQILFAAVVLAGLGLGWDLSGFLVAGTIAVAALTVMSGALYMRDWVQHMGEDSKETDA